MTRNVAPFRRGIRNAFGYDKLAQRNRARSIVQQNTTEEGEGEAKFTPVQAYYVEQSPIASMSCRGCAYWIDKGDEVGECKIVNGPIRADGVCNFWAIRGTKPAKGRILAAQILYGRGPDAPETPIRDSIVQWGQNLYKAPPETDSGT